MSFAAKSQRAAPSGGQAKTAVRAGGPAKIASRVRDVVDGPGGLLDPATRDFMEPRFGHSFGAVRVHADGRAADSARAVNAAAYTVGPHIVFGGGAYAPQSAAGRRLLAHELAHVVQQSRGGTRAPAPLAGGALERSAEAAASAAMGGGAGLVAVSGRSGVGLARDARSLHGTVVPSELSNDELEQETYLVQEWLSANAHSGEEGEHMLQALQQLEAEAAKRSAKPEQPKAPLLPSVHSGDSAILASVMRQIDGIRPSEVASGLFTMELEGQRKDLTGDQVARIKREATNVLKDHLRQILTKAEGAQAGYDAQTETDKKHWIVAPIVKTLGRIKDPGPYLTGDVARARALVARAKDAMAAGSFAQGAEALAGAETSAVSAEKLWQAYFEGIIGAGEMTVTGLEITRDAAFITLGVLATIATAGAAAGATTTALGVEVGTATAANTIATAAPVLAGLAEAGSKVALGDPVDWGALAVDTVAQLVLARFGGKLTGGMTKAILGKAGRGLSRVVVEKAVHTAIFHVSSTLLMTAAQDAYRALKSGGKNITWEFFANDVIRRLTDPKGLAVAAITGTLTVGAEVKFGGGASPAVGTGAPATEGAGGQGAPRSASAPAVESPPPAAPNPEPIPAHGAGGQGAPRSASVPAVESPPPAAPNPESIPAPGAGGSTAPAKAPSPEPIASPAPASPAREPIPLSESDPGPMKITRNGDTGESSPKAAPAEGIPLSEVDPGPLKVLRNGETGEPMSRKKPAEGIPLSKKPAGRPKILRNGDTGETPAKTVPADGLELPASSERLASEAQGAKLSREEQLAGIRKRSEVEDVREKTPSKPARTAARARTDVGTVEVGQPDPAFPGSKVEAVEIDHVYPLDKMYKLKGAAQLSREDLIILGNTPENLVPVSRKVNGSRRNLSYREWSQTNEIGRSADPEYISSMITLEQEMEALLQERVNTLLRARMQAEMTPELRNGIANGIDLN